MTGNPLVAAAADTPKDAWAGVWIAEDIQLIQQGVKNGSWIDATLGTVGTSLDALALVVDPAGTLVQYGIAWLIEHVKPLSDALDWLAGDPAQITAHAHTWRNISHSLQASANDLRQDDLDWHGTAAEAYRAWATEQRHAITGIATAADTMATIAEATACLIAAVRVMVRDAIATVVSRIAVYAVELIASLGAATPLVVEQVTALVATWAARIARWLKTLLASLRRLMPIIRRLGELIDELKKILSRLRSGEPPHSPPRPPTREEMLDELARLGIKHNPDDIVKIAKDADGKIIFLERGNAKAGLQHILERHADDFATVGIPRENVADVVFDAVQQGRIVGTQRGRPVYEVVYDGKTYEIAISVGNNGFIVGANPTGRPR